MNKRWMPVAAVLAMLIPMSGAFSYQQVSTNMTVTPDNRSQAIATFNVTAAPGEQVNLSQTNYLRDLEFHPATVPGGTSELVTVRTRVESDTAPGNLSGTIVIENSSVRDFIPFTITVPSYPRWTISPQQIRFNATANNSAEIGQVTVDNTGNVDLQFNININSTSPLDINNLIDVNQFFTVRAGDTRTLPVSYSAHVSQQPGQYNGTLYIQSGNDVVHNVSVHGTVHDDLPPTVRVQANHTQATVPSKVVAHISDNLDLEAVNGTVTRTVEEELEGNQTGTRLVNETVETLDFQKRNAGTWVSTVEDTRLRGTYTVTVTAWDGSENRGTNTTTFTVTDLNAVNLSRTNPTIPPVKQGTWSTVDLFRIEHGVPVNISLSTFKYGGVTNGSLGNTTIQLVLPNGGTEFFETEGSTVTVDEPGLYQLRVKGNRIDPYNARFTFQSIRQHVSIPSVTVTGSFDTFSRPDPFQRPWAGAEFLKCGNSATVEMQGKTYTWASTNVVSESRFICVVPFKTRLVGQNFENEAVPMPLKVWNIVNEENQDKVDRWRNRARDAEGENLLHWIAHVLGVLIFVFVVFIRPRLNIEVP